MNHARAALFVAVAAAVSAFASGCTSTAAEFEKVCNGEQLSGAAGETDPNFKIAKIFSYWQANLREGGEARSVVEAVGHVGPGDKGRILAQAAKEGGYNGPCPIADLLQSGEKAGN